jgi:dienelactone hydrolase
MAIERKVPGGTRIELALHDGERIPAVLLLPSNVRRAPASLLIHGYTSRKEHMSDAMGRALLARGVASVAIDLPLHGERGAPIDTLSIRNPFELVRRWTMAIDDCRIALRYLEGRDDIDAERLGLVGYSLGSFLGVMVAAREQAVRAVVLASGGDLPEETPFSKLVRTAADPLRAVRKLRGRPLLMVHGRWDRTVKPAQAQRLFDSAGDPKEIRWWDAGHHLPAAAIADGADWLATKLGEDQLRVARG